MEFTRHLYAFVLFAALISATTTPSTACAQNQGQSASAGNSTPIKVTIEKSESGWQIFRDGKPYQIKGGGGAEKDSLLKELANAGGNSTRTWGVNSQTRQLLDRAHANGISVTVGFWLGHERHGMNYSNYDQSLKQIEKTLADVKKLKDHPAVLMWGLGNEMEGPEGDNPAVWLHLEYLAQRIKEMDPNHPVMTVIAEVGGKKVEALHKFCPSIDIVGVNAYGGAPTLPKRYKAAGGTKPYVVTEFGPLGTWEVGKDNNDAIVEMPSTEKVNFYRNAYQAIQSDKRGCLGAYAFLWGQKQEATTTWFGMFTPDGKRTGAVDLMQEMWTGSKPDNLCPTIRSLTVEGPNELKPGDVATVSLDTADPENQPLSVVWKVLAESDAYNTLGDIQPEPPTLENVLVSSTLKSAKIKMPAKQGIIRVYAFVEDPMGSAATANVAIKVSSGQSASSTAVAAPAAKAQFPVVVFDEQTQEPLFVPSGYMGSTDDILLNENCTEFPKVGSRCLKCSFLRNDDWGGVVWQSPANDWGDLPGGLNFEGAKKLTFWARGEQGGEKVKFGFGLIGKDKPFHDTAKDEIEVALQPNWTQYSFDLSSRDLSRMKSAFYWSLAGQGRNVVFYLDRIVIQ